MTPDDAVVEAVKSALENELRPYGFGLVGDGMGKIAKAIILAYRRAMRERGVVEIGISRLLRNGALDEAPCMVCGYNGPGFFQPKTHKCRAMLAAVESEGPTG